MSVPPALPAVLLARHHTHQDVAARVRRGTWRRVARGAYVDQHEADDPRRAALARVVAVHRRLTAPHVFSHESAALLRGFPLWSLPDEVHLYQQHRPGAGRDRGVRRHVGALDPRTVGTVRGLPVTTPELTAVDCARTTSPLPALVVADAALHAGASRDEMLRLLDRDPAGRGAARARAVLLLADAGAESAQESALRFVLLRAGLPRPMAQVPVETRLGTFWPDLGWPEWHVALEYDGRVKYTGAEALVREKRRHDAVAETGWQMLRVTKEDLRTPQALVTRVRALLPPTVRLTPRPHLRSR